MKSDRSESQFHFNSNSTQNIYYTEHTTRTKQKSLTAERALYRDEHLRRKNRNKNKDWIHKKQSVDPLQNHIKRYILSLGITHSPPNYVHFLWTMEGPDSSYSSFLIHPM